MAWRRLISGIPLSRLLAGWTARRALIATAAVIAAVGLIAVLVIETGGSGSPRVRVSGGGGPGTTSTTTTLADGLSSSGTTAGTTTTSEPGSKLSTTTTTRARATTSSTAPATGTPARVAPGTPTATKPSGSSTGGTCVSPPGTDQGVTTRQIEIAVLVSTTAAESAADQQAAYQDVIDSINAAGGVACRQLVARFIQVNPADTTSLQQSCQSVIQAHVFYAVAPGVYDHYPAQAGCLPQAGVPVMAGLISEKMQSQYYPYLFGTGTFEEVYRNTVYALAQRGTFSAANGFSELGLLYRDCIPELSGEVEGWLNQVGVPSAKIAAYDVGCPNGKATPSDLQQAVMAFGHSHVSNVMIVDSPQDFADFSQMDRTAKFDLPDDGVVAADSSSPANTPSSTADGAIAITPNRYGEQDTAGMSPTAGTAYCNSVLTAHGQPPVYQQPQGLGGVACDALWMFDVAVSYSPQIQRSSLAAGLQAARSLDFSYPLGPNNFASARTTFGDQYWRVDQYHASCSCWQVLDSTFHPSFP